MKINPFGMRTIKTGLSVALTLLICSALKIENPFFALIASSMAVESSVSESINVSKNRLIGTFIGAFIAIVFASFFPINPISMGLGIMILIYISNTLKLKKSIKISTIVFIAILVNNDETTRIQYALFRSFDTFIGLSIGTLVNYYIKPPNTSSDFVNYIHQKTQNLNLIYETFLSNPESINYHEMITSLLELDEKITLIKDESKYHHDSFSKKNTILSDLERLKHAYTHLSVLAPDITPQSHPLAFDYHLQEVRQILNLESK